MVRNDNQGEKMTSLRSPLQRRLLDALLDYPSPSFPLLLCRSVQQQAPDWQTTNACLRQTVCILGPVGQEVEGRCVSLTHRTGIGNNPAESETRTS